jgi:hypothetical protein
MGRWRPSQFEGDDVLYLNNMDNLYLLVYEFLRCEMYILFKIFDEIGWKH